MKVKVDREHARPQLATYTHAHMYTLIQPAEYYTILSIVYYTIDTNGGFTGTMNNVYEYYKESAISSCILLLSRLHLMPGSHSSTELTMTSENNSLENSFCGQPAAD